MAASLQVIRCLLIEPYPESALNEEAGKLLLEDYTEYAQHARYVNTLVPSGSLVHGMLVGYEGRTQCAFLNGLPFWPCAWLPFIEAQPVQNASPGTTICCHCEQRVAPRHVAWAPLETSIAHCCAAAQSLAAVHAPPLAMQAHDVHPRCAQGS